MAQRVGSLKYKLPVYRKSVTEDDYGAGKTVWTEVMTIRASVRRLKGSEQIEQSEQIDIYWIEIDVRNQYDLREQDRIVYNGAEFSIEFINPSYLQRWHTLRCKRING